MILSASRRTDIPSYYSKWFMNRVKEGYVLTKNPMNPSQIKRVELSPDTIDCIVFWTKDPAEMIEQLQQLSDMGYHYYFQFTITPYGKEIERNLREKKEIVRTFQQLSDMLGRDRVLWRYDPIILNQELTIDYHIKNFQLLCSELQDYTQICTISFVDIYSKLNKRVKEDLIKEISPEQMHQLAQSLSEIGQKAGIELRACCEKLDLTMDGVKPAACIDKEIIERVCGHALAIKKDNSQRNGCGCYQSVDIGVYNTCKNGCIYCYANHSMASIQKNYLIHDPDSDILIGSKLPNSQHEERK